MNVMKKICIIATIMITTTSVVFANATTKEASFLEESTLFDLYSDSFKTILNRTQTIAEGNKTWTLRAEKWTTANGFTDHLMWGNGKDGTEETWFPYAFRQTGRALKNITGNISSISYNTARAITLSPLATSADLVILTSKVDPYFKENPALTTTLSIAALGGTAYLWNKFNGTAHLSHVASDAVNYLQNKQYAIAKSMMRKLVRNLSLSTSYIHQGKSTLGNALNDALFNAWEKTIGDRFINDFLPTNIATVYEDAKDIGTTLLTDEWYFVGKSHVNWFGNVLSGNIPSLYEIGEEALLLASLGTFFVIDIFAR